MLYRNFSPVNTAVKLRLYHPEKSAVAEHSINLGCRIQLQNNSILAKKSRRMNRVIREAIEIVLHPET
jgi:hypothetical protein